MFQWVFIGLSASTVDPARFAIGVLPHGVIEDCSRGWVPVSPHIAALVDVHITP